MSGSYLFRDLGLPVTYRTAAANKTDQIPADRKENEHAVEIESHGCCSCHWQARLKYKINNQVLENTAHKTKQNKNRQKDVEDFK